MKWWYGGEDSDDSVSQDVHVVKNDDYRTKIVVSRAVDPEDSRVGNSFDEHPLEDDDYRNGSAKRLVHMRRSFLYAVTSTCLFAIVILILSVGFAKNLFWTIPDTDNDSPKISSNYTSNNGEERTGRLYQYLVTRTVNGAEAFNDPISPESQALAWMQYNDELDLDPIDSEYQFRIDQRFALLTLWFQSDYEWFRQNNWLSGHECSWEGVECEFVSPWQSRSLSKSWEDSERDLQVRHRIVTKLNLANNNLQGNLPPNLHMLKNLTSLNLSWNQIHGTIPKLISSMIWLENLQLNDNILSQELSLDFSNMSNLIELNLSNNQLTGQIPSSLYQAVSITHIQLDNNEFTGRILEDIETLSNLGK